METLIDARVISSSHHRPFVSSSPARKNFDLPYMLLNSESNFPRLPGPRCKIGYDRFARVPKHSLGDFEARFIACIITQLLSTRAGVIIFLCQIFQIVTPVCINAISKREATDRVIKNTLHTYNNLLVMFLHAISIDM